jgi:geranylgeranyl pyrophosphate synthase
MTKHGAVEEALGVAQSLSNDANAVLTVFPNSMPRRALMALADFVVQREM